MSGHGHSHSGGHGHSHSHEDLEGAERGNLYSLYLKIDTDRVQCLNEEIHESGKTVFKPWDKRLDTDDFVQSDADEELLFNIPFTGNVKLKGIIIIGGEDDSHPSFMKLYKNRPNMTFDDVAAAPDQEFEVSPDRTGIIEYATKVARFNSVETLSIYFPRNYGADLTKIYYIGLKGDFTEARRQMITITNYELSANPADHKTEAFNKVFQQIQ